MKAMPSGLLQQALSHLPATTCKPCLFICQTMTGTVIAVQTAVSKALGLKVGEVISVEKACKQFPHAGLCFAHEVGIA